MNWYKSAMQVYKDTDASTIDDSPPASLPSAGAIVPSDLSIVAPEAIPNRLPTQVLRIWLAPWVDKQGNWHSGGVVMTDIYPREWQSARKQLMASMDEKLSSSHLIVLKDIRDHINFLSEKQQKLEVQILSTIQPWKEAWQLLQTLPGVSEMSAAVLIAEIGDDMSQFGGMKEIASWAGLCPGNNESVGKRKSGRTRKGNKMIKTTLCEVANAAIKTKSQFKGKYQSLVIRRGHKRSLIAIAHKLIRVIYTNSVF